MAEGRMLKKEISDSKKLGRLPSDRPRVLYLMMLPHLDVKGRLYADPKNCLLYTSPSPRDRS